MNTRAGEPLGIPLFSGRLEFWRKTDNIRGTYRRIKSYLYFNPTRAIKYQGERLTGNTPTTWQNRILADSRESQTTEITRSYGGGDNFLMRSISQSQYIRGENKYIDTIFEALEGDIAHAARLYSMTARVVHINHTNISLHEIETYWEFNLPDAIRYLERITPTLKLYGRHIREREHGNHAIDEVTEMNSKSVTVRLGKGESIIFYVKTGNRLRIEVKHKPYAQSNILPDGYSSENITAFKAKLLLIKDRAASTVNALLQFMAQMVGESPQERASSSRYAFAGLR